LVDYLKTQKGSRTIQKKLSLTSNGFECIDFLLNLIVTSFSDLMKDQYANYFCKELFTYCSVKNNLLILQNVCILSSILKKIFYF
jgi:hypothetical protein